MPNLPYTASLGLLTATDQPPGPGGQTEKKDQDQSEKGSIFDPLIQFFDFASRWVLENAVLVGLFLIGLVMLLGSEVL